MHTQSMQQRLEYVKTHHFDRENIKAHIQI